jgi:hypothetical protein
LKTSVTYSLNQVKVFIMNSALVVVKNLYKRLTSFTIMYAPN